MQTKIKKRPNNSLLKRFYDDERGDGLTGPIILSALILITIVAVFPPIKNAFLDIIYEVINQVRAMFGLEPIIR
jgi:hypothetical protein